MEVRGRRSQGKGGESANFQTWVNDDLYSGKSGVGTRRICQELRNRVVKT
jgi:hypothetical protein